jgi:hypothetical protein
MRGASTLIEKLYHSASDQRGCEHRTGPVPATRRDEQLRRIGERGLPADQITQRGEECVPPAPGMVGIVWKLVLLR